MTSDQSQHDLLLALLYGLLPDDEAAALRSAIRSDPAVRAAYAQVEREASLLADAARCDVPGAKIDWEARARQLASQDVSSAMESPIRRVDGARSSPWRWWVRSPDARGVWPRAANWAMAVASTVLLCIAATGWALRAASTPVTGDGVRLQVVGPPLLQRGTEQSVTVRATTVAGQAVQEPIELTLIAPNGRVFQRAVETTGPSGDAILRFKVPDETPDAVRLVLAGAMGDSHSVAGSVPVRSSGQLVYLEARSEVVESEATIDCRAVAVSSADLQAVDGLALELTVRDVEGRLLGQESPTTRRGVAHARFQVPASEAVVPLQVTATGPDTQPTHVALGRSASGSVDSAAGAVEPPADPMPEGGKAGPLNFAVFPEGGSLTPGVVNRVYFRAMTGEATPADVEAHVLDPAGQRIARAAALHPGLGVVGFTPEPNVKYRVVAYADGRRLAEQMLPAEPNHAGISLAAIGSIVETDQPLRLDVRTARTGVPVVVAVARGETPVVQTAMVLNMRSSRVELPLPREASGVLRVTVYAYDSTPPRVVAERFMYRHIEPGLVLDAHVSPEGVLRVNVADELGRPVACTLGVQVVPIPGLNGGPIIGTSLAASDDVTLPEFFRLTRDLGRLEPWIDVPFLLSGSPEANAALDLVLATRSSLADGWTGIPPASPVSNMDPTRTASLAPLVFDNLPSLRGAGEPTDEATAARWQMLQVIVILDLLGAVGLILLLAMLQTLRISTGVRQWAPAVVVAMTVVFLAAHTFPPADRPGNDWAIAYASHGFDITERPRVALKAMSKVQESAQALASEEVETRIKADAEAFADMAVASIAPEEDRFRSSSPDSRASRAGSAPLHAPGAVPNDSLGMPDHASAPPPADMPMRSTRTMDPGSPLLREMEGTDRERQSRDDYGAAGSFGSLGGGFNGYGGGAAAFATRPEGPVTAMDSTPADEPHETADEGPRPMLGAARTFAATRASEGSYGDDGGRSDDSVAASPAIPSPAPAPPSNADRQVDALTEEWPASWFPVVEVPDTGSVTVSLQRPLSDAGYQIRITAHTSDGRFGAGDFLWTGNTLERSATDH